MEDIIKEIRQDIKDMLQAQARMEERMKNHAEDMHDFKQSSELKIKKVEEKLEPIYKWHIGAKWAIGAALTIGSLLTVYFRLFK